LLIDPRREVLHENVAWGLRDGDMTWRIVRDGPGPGLGRKIGYVAMILGRNALLQDARHGMQRLRLAKMMVFGLFASLACARADPPVAAPSKEPDRRSRVVESGCSEADGIAACVDTERIIADVRRIAHPRPPGSTHWLRTQSLCAETFAELGYEVEQHRYETGINVLGTRLGNERPHERVVVGAHYDHIAGCDGADDNATGVAGVLEIARVLAGRSLSRTLVLACWDEEERGLLGSSAWVRRAGVRNEEIAVYFNFDAIGVRRAEPGTQRVPAGFELLFAAEVAQLERTDYRGDFIAIISNRAARHFADAVAEHSRRRDLPNVVLEVGAMLLATPLVIDLRRSDHAAFWDANIPAVMITDTAEFRTPTYHCRGAPDAFETIDPGFVGEVVRATAAAVLEASAAPQP
jgi:hypothetical protein